MIRTIVIALTGIVFSILQIGCTAYAAPGAAADLATFGATKSQQAAGTEISISEQFNKKPLASFPSRIAVVRVQAAGYYSQKDRGWGQGVYSVILTREVETEAQFDRLSRLPMVQAITPIGRMLLREQLDSDKEIREGAAKLQCDMVLVYTFETEFHDENVAEPLTLVTLGVFPNHVNRVNTTVSAVLLDTRSGFVYGVASATGKKEKISSPWSSCDALDAARLDAERESFQNLIPELEKMWTGVLRNHIQPPVAGPVPG